MVKSDLVAKVSEATGLTKSDSHQVVENVFELIKSTLAASEKIKITGFGNFEVASKSARRGRNPQTGEEMTISQRKVISFKSSPLLRSKINGKASVIQE